jgi:hypothetical protein
MVPLFRAVADGVSRLRGLASRRDSTRGARSQQSTSFENRVLAPVGDLTMSAQLNSGLVRVVRSIALVASAFTAIAVAGMSAAEAATVTLNVISARTEPAALGGTGVTKGDAITTFKFLVNIDNTGTTEQRSPAAGSGCSPGDTAPDGTSYPNTCNWVSIAGAKSHSPVYTQGTDSDAAAALANVPEGRYLISVLADGYKLDGQHFSVDAAGNVIVNGVAQAGGVVTVNLQPTPLPDAQIQAAVFEDISPVNSAPDLPAEHGLAGFQGHILDVLGEVTTNVYGDPLCSKYDASGNLIPGSGGKCMSACYVVSNGADVGTVAPIDAAGRCPVDITLADGVTPRPMLEGGTVPAGAAIEGKVKIPNLGPNRYTLSVTPPDGSGWIQTTTLEGNHDWDAWVMEGATGLDTEFIIAGEPFPAIIFGYVPAPGTPSAVGSPISTPLGGTGTIKGFIERVKIYVPTTGGAGGLPGEIWGGLQGAVPDKPEDKAWITLTNLGNGDTIVWAGQGDADGKFTIPNVPAGTYTLTWWDEPQNQILDLVNVTVGAGETIDMGLLPLSGWWTVFDGYVYNDTNRNGVRDPGEPGLSGYTLTMRRRDNSLMDRGSTLVTTDANGYYKFEAGYPMTQWLVMEAYDDLHYTTGITYQADNQPTATTVLGAGVDVSVFPIIGLSGHMDWGKHAYDATGANGIDPRNGGIVGTVSYDTTRNELDPRYAAVEDWQPSVSDLVVKLFKPVACGTNSGTPCDATGRYELASDGSFAKGQLLNTYLSETWQRPSGCVARGADGTPVVHGADEKFLPLDDSKECLEAPMMGVQFSGGDDTKASFPGVAVDGNYGFGDGCFEPNVLDATDPSAPVCRTGPLTTDPEVEFAALPAADYLVQVDLSSQLDTSGNPIYKVTREEDINIGNGDEFIPAVPPSECAGALHTVDVAGIGVDGPNATVNPTFVDIGGSPYEGQQRPLCDVKLVRLDNGKSIAPAFNVFTDVPLPGRHWFIIIDDLNFSSNPQSITYGEKAGMPFVPVGIYDYTDRLVTTVESDYNGLADVLLPSTNRISCPTPSGVCANLYRYVGNDPGVPGRLNANFNPSFRTISAEFEVLPGQIIPADLAPTQVGVTVQLPGGQNTAPVMCMLDETSPQLYAVSSPVVDATNRDLVIDGAGFGTGGTLTLGTATLATTAWSDTQITATVPSDAAVGPQQLMIQRADNGKRTVNGLTIHVVGTTLPAFPSTGVLDNFNRTGFGNSWNVSSTSVFSLSSPTGGNTSTYNVRVTGTGWMRWRSTYGANQEAYFTFYKVSPTATEQGLFLKITGNSTDPTSSNDAYIEVAYNAPSSTVQVRSKASGTSTVVLQASFPASFAAGDQFGARALSDGTVIAYKNGTEVGRVNVPLNATSNSSRLGVRFVGAANNTTNDARFDNFGGGNITLSGYTPRVYEVGPGKGYQPYETLPATADHAIQRALNDAASYVGGGSNRDALVVVYPNNASTNPRQNPRGAYYENLIINAKVKLQGVGPGSPDGSVRGSIIDGSAFAGDSPVATDWYTLIGTLGTTDADGNFVPSWSGNATIYDGAVISLYLPSNGNRAFPTAYNALTAPSIDGFDLRGGDQQGFPGNINAIGGGATGLPGGLITQGGAIFANAYARNLQITNNVVQNNGGAYGTIRIGTPDLPAPDTDNQNRNVNIAYNRIITNAGTNQAGGIGLFNGSNGYQVVYNDICGNFSAEYGGGVSAVGYSPGGTINNNRIYFNRSFDEGGGIMIAGALPATPTSLSPGSGAVSIYNNLIQANLSNDDGGGIRFLMAGNFPMDVYNNFIVNNISTHEGGGISINDAPNVRVFNNTIMKNLTTATAATSLGSPAPAGLSTSVNSDLLQATLPASAPTFSNPLLFNNIFWDNRAGTRAGNAVTGLGNLGDCSSGCDYWDLGVADSAAVLAPTNSIVQQTTHPYTSSPTNSTADPLIVSSYDVGVTFNSWRNNPAFLGAIMISADLPPYLLGDYHVKGSSPASQLGAAGKSGVSAPAFDIDNQDRPSPAGTALDAGADEVPNGTTTPPPTAGTGTVSFLSASLGTLSGSTSGSTLNFGATGGSVNQSTITLQVTGGSVTFGAVTVQGGNGNRFSEVTPATLPCEGATLNDGDLCHVTVNFDATGNTLRTGALTVDNNSSNGAATLTLTGQ